MNKGNVEYRYIIFIIYDQKLMVEKLPTFFSKCIIQL